MALTVTTEDSDALVLVHLDGELDIYTVPNFRQDIERFDPAETQMVVDLSDVTILDSSGIGALVSLLNRAKPGIGRLGVVCPQENLQRVFEVTGLKRAFAFGEDLAGVQASLSAATS